MIPETLIREALKNVYDPELGVNIVDLGLVYDIRQDDGRVQIEMTLTTPGCPLHESMFEGTKAALSMFKEIEDVDVRLVWEPPWTPDMMTKEGREQLGFYE